MFDPTTYTGFHTWLSLVALVTGALAIADMMRGRTPSALLGVFLATAVATNLTGFGFPFSGVLPSHIVGIISMIILIAAGVTWSDRGQPTRRGRIFGGSIVAATYLLAFVTVAQAFQKVAALGGQGIGFAVAQLIVLAGFVALGTALVRRKSYSARAIA